MPATSTAVRAGSSAATTAPVCDEALTAGSGVAPACQSAAAAPVSIKPPSGRAERANAPAAAASSAVAA